MQNLFNIHSYISIYTFINFLLKKVNLPKTSQNLKSIKKKTKLLEEGSTLEKINESGWIKNSSITAYEETHPQIADVLV